MKNHYSRTYMGDEITTSFYVDKENHLHGHITLLEI